MKTIPAIALLILAAPLFALADPPTSRPTLPLENMGLRPRPGLHGHPGAGRENAPSTRPISFGPAEWDDAMTFMQQYSPNRAAALKDAMSNPKLPENLLKGLQAQVVKKWRNYKLLDEGKFHSMAVLSLQRIGIEDDIYDLSTKVQADPSQTSGIRQQIRDDAAKLVDLSIQEQTTRIENLKELLDKEQTTLGTTQKNRANLIDERTNKILERAHVSPLPANGEHGDASHVLDDITANAEILMPADDTAGN